LNSHLGFEMIKQHQHLYFCSMLNL